MIVRHVYQGIIILCLLFNISTSNAFTSNDAVKKAITQAVLPTLKNTENNNPLEPSESASILISNINTQLNLKDCDKELTVKDFIPQAKKQRQVVKVICEQPQWSIYVPITITLPTQETLTRTTALHKAHQYTNDYLDQLRKKKEISISSFDLTINDALLNRTTLPKNCSTTLTSTFEIKIRRTASLFAKVTCLGVPSWKITVPFNVEFTSLTELTPHDFTRQVTQFIDNSLENNPHISQNTTRIDYNIQDIPFPSSPCFSKFNFSFSHSRAVIGRNTIRPTCLLPKKTGQPINVIINGYKNIVYSTRHIIRGEIIQPGDITLKEIHANKANLHQFETPTGILGLKAKGSISKNRPIIDTDLSKRILVYQGDRVILTAKTSGIVVRMPGKALTDGIFGQQIRIQNTHSKKIVIGKVVAEGKIEIIL